MDAWPIACSTTQARCYVPRASVPARHSERSPSGRGRAIQPFRLENGIALPSDSLLDAILDAYGVAPVCLGWNCWSVRRPIGSGMSTAR
jgi:hypothetical protein